VLHIVLTASPRLSNMRLADALVEFLSRDVGIVTPGDVKNHPLGF